MKKLFWLSGIILLSVILLAVSGCLFKQTVSLKNQTEKISYYFGRDMGTQFFKPRGVKIDYKCLIKGIDDALNNRKSLLTDQEVNNVIAAYQKDVAAAQMEHATKNQQKGEAFLAENKKKPGVITLPSGLQYQVIKNGTGATPKLTDNVTVHYVGTLLDGTEFDSSYKRGEPATLSLQRSIPGWQQALQLMKVGSRWKLFIPSNLAYGQQGPNNGVIGPNETLIFEVELIAVNNK